MFLLSKKSKWNSLKSPHTVVGLYFSRQNPIYQNDDEVYLTYNNDQGSVDKSIKNWIIW